MKVKLLLGSLNFFGVKSEYFCDFFEVLDTKLLVIKNLVRIRQNFEIFYFGLPASK